jgi:ribosomal protein S27E
MHRKRLHRNGYYVVDVTCPHCGHVTTVAFAGWIALTCPACAKEFARGPYLTPLERAIRDAEEHEAHLHAEVNVLLRTLQQRQAQLQKAQDRLAALRAGKE